ncbi:Glycoside hydrolase [Macleaya cordata]|uniref:Glycoside hydrolase n=1 Tax=Macleaya cordata TaxID=56857 RepID=A0A200QYT9_MACCD|nr:Glycoside hydrolase [Macleaya cordata]
MTSNNINPTILLISDHHYKNYIKKYRSECSHQTWSREFECGLLTWICKSEYTPMKKKTRFPAPIMPQIKLGYYYEDVKLMHEMGLDAYRFSISWSRILPDGHGDVNQKGLNYYNSLINELVTYGIEAHVTLDHFDLPQALEDEYEGFLSPNIIGDFTAYADICFKEFGDRVNSWMTFKLMNLTYRLAGNDIGIIPPERCSYPFGTNYCTKGNSTTEPYIAAHNILLSHTAAANLYREKYQEKQRGHIGITLQAFWLELVGKYYNLAADDKFSFGTFLDPLVYGNYPAIMRKIVGSRLPSFTENESKKLRGSFDFIGLNHYSVVYVQDMPRNPNEYGSDYVRDVSARVSSNRLKANTRVPIESWGLERLLEYVKLKYGSPVVIHEIGYQTSEDDSSNLAAQDDTKRIEYLQKHIESLLLSIRNGSNVKGYFMWSFMDSFEWIFGYTARYSLYGVDFNDKDRKRYPRLSAYWYSSLIGKKMAEEPKLRFLFLSLTLFFFFFLLELHLLHIVAVTAQGDRVSSTIPSSVLISRSDFPPGFVFGAGSSAYQVEGAAAEDGRKPSIWDSFTHAGKTSDKRTGDIASDQYHKYKEDVKLMHEMGLDAYRFSISWSRILPDGHGYVNQKGLNYYNNLINELISYGIEAHVTLSQFDLPQALQDEYGGLLSRKIIGDFTAYADICFKEFGDRVKSWMTFSEPNIQTVMGNDIGIIPPGHCSYPFGINCSKGNSTTEPYIAAHNIILSHAAAAKLYRDKYQEKQRGQIGITLLAFWLEPFTDSPQDVAATKRLLDFHLGWFLDPLVYGNYPAIMRKIVGSRLPFFTENESKQLRGSFDFIGLNHYSVVYVQDFSRTPDKYDSDYIRDISARLSFVKGVPATDFFRLKGNGMPTASWGLQRVLEYVKLKYKSPAVLIHENGYQTTVDDSSNPAARDDIERIEYLQEYVESVLLSIRNGSNVRGYFVWSFIDCFELMFGYTAHFGLYGVEFNDKDRKRYPRLSAHWYSSFLKESERKTGSRYTY